MHYVQLSANDSLSHVYVPSKMVVNGVMCKPSIEPCVTPRVVFGPSYARVNMSY